ncbi:Os02g0743450 [Oryza sativa Japonica Group]|uniref:Os02g0743450 protein n=1 Tax=Oryza sativa subsp. japonica TaxID=39947 RepID=A0A0P0VPK5_ORYSJ|nr:hypothetical protein EE612_013630 [Oryza sativa]BAS80872.1 Os02g0743450 [Oryza sativa Japonica Group]
MHATRLQPKQDVVDEGDRQGDEHAKDDRCAENARVHAVLLGEDEGDNALGQSCLDNGDVQERATESDGEGRRRHHGRPGQEPHRHGVRRHLVPARDDVRLQRHEQTETEHGHAEPRVRQDRDGFQDDGRHLEPGVYAPEADEGPDEADEAGVGVRVADELAPHHDQDEAGHHARRRHRRRRRHGLAGVGARRRRRLLVPCLRVPVHDAPVPEAEIVPLHVVLPIKDCYFCGGT